MSQVSYPKREKKKLACSFSMKVNTSLVFVVDECNFVKESAAIEDLPFGIELGAFPN